MTPRRRRVISRPHTTATSAPRCSSASGTTRSTARPSTRVSSTPSTSRWRRSRRRSAWRRPGRARRRAVRGHQDPGMVRRAMGREDERRPCILVGGGWDSTMVENSSGSVWPRSTRLPRPPARRPGQGQLLIDEGLTLRHDWRSRGHAGGRRCARLDVVDPDRIVYEPWSLGGYMAPRVAAYEHRLAAVIADPGQIDIGGKITGPWPRWDSAPTPSPACPSSRPRTRRPSWTSSTATAGCTGRSSSGGSGRMAAATSRAGWRR